MFGLWKYSCKAFFEFSFRFPSCSARLWRKTSSAFQGWANKIFAIANLLFLLLLVFVPRKQNHKKILELGDDKKCWWWREGRRENSIFSYGRKNKLSFLLLSFSLSIVAALYEPAKSHRKKMYEETIKANTCDVHIKASFGVSTIGFKNLILHSWAAICIRFM